MSQLHAVPLRARTLGALAGVSAVGVIAFFWPFVVAPQASPPTTPRTPPGSSPSCSPLVVAVLLAEVSGGGWTRRGGHARRPGSGGHRSPASGRGCRGTRSRCSWCSTGRTCAGSGVRFRTGQPGDVHLRALDGRGRPVAAVPDDGRRMVCDGGGVVAAAAREELKSRCSWPTGSRLPCCTGS